MKTVQVVCIDQSDSSPSCTPDRRTNAITRVGQIDELDALGGVDVDGLGDDRESAALADVVLATGVSRTVTTELLDITLHVTFRVQPTRTRTGREAGFKAHTVPPL